MPTASVNNGSDSEDNLWSNVSDDTSDCWEEVCAAIDSAAGSSTGELQETPPPTTERQTRSQYIDDVFNYTHHQLGSLSSPIKPRAPKPKLSHNRRTPVRRQDRESSEDEVAELATDTESSPPSSRQPTQLFIDLSSRTTSMMSVQSQQSLSSSFSSQKKKTELQGLTPPSSPHTTIRRAVEVAAQIREPAQGHGSDRKTTSGGIHFPPVVVDDILTDRHGSAPNRLSSPIKLNSSPSRRVPVPHNSAGVTTYSPRPPPAPPISAIEIAMPSPSTMVPAGPFGVNLNPVLIAHDAKIQRYIDDLHLSWGVQYELARGISIATWGWSDITLEKLTQLKGSNTEAAHKVSTVMIGEPRENNATFPEVSIWNELDREQKAIMENRSRGLGLLDDGEWEGAVNWYGGQVQQIARLTKVDSTYAVHLEPLEKRRSNRFARFLGSRRIIQLHVPQELKEKIREFTLQKFVLWGRIFVPFHSKKEGLYMTETNENLDRRSDYSSGDQFRMTFDQFIEWHNSPRLNANQSMSKWSTRWALGLSTSVPVIEFEGKNMFLVDDILAEDWLCPEKPPAEKIMTDGCGFINGAALRLIFQRLKSSSRPTAIQGRVAGAKGLWVLHPTDKEPDAPPRIWIRLSQNKIQLPLFITLDRAHRIFDLVGPSRVSMPYYLSRQSIINLSHNGVPNKVFVDLMADRLKEDVRQLTDWTRPNAMFFTWDAISKAGSVAGTRLQRCANGTSRALGLSGRDYHRTVETDSGNVLEELESPISMGRNRFSGAPVSLYEYALELIQAGFHPLDCQLLYDKLKYILRNVVDTAVKKYRSPILQSAEAFIISDPIPGGVLKEGEIYFRSSQSLTDPTNGRYFDTLEGPVIVGRNPICVPSDMQKVTAVNYAELSEYYDVAIFSTKGSRSLQSLLSGGDSDGDITLMIWDPSFTKSFSNAPFVPPPDDFVSQNFERQIESVDEFGCRFASLPPHEAEKEFQKILLLGLADLNVGLYSKFHDVTLYGYGYDSAESRRLAHMFAIALDSSKTGLRVKHDVLKTDKSKYNRAPPKCMGPSDQDSDRGNIPRHLSDHFILDILMEVGTIQSELHLREYDKLEPRPGRDDQDLLSPYKTAKSNAVLSLDAGFKAFHNELDLIEQHVRAVRRKWQTVGSRSQKQSRVKKQGKDPYHELAEQFAAKVPGIIFTVNADKVKASFAYSLGAKFGFCMAFKLLCAIKAEANVKGNVPLLQSFGDVMTIPSSALRALAQNHDDF